MHGMWLQGNNLDEKQNSQMNEWLIEIFQQIRMQKFFLKDEVERMNS